jgi:hypothetical protein
MYVGTGPANILGERTPCNKSSDLHPGQGNLLHRDKVIYFTGTIFLWSTKFLFTSQNRVEIS